MKMKVVIIIFIVLIVSILLYLNYNKSNKSTETKVRYVSMNEIVQIMNENEGYIILDVRTAEEYKEGHIPNAINVANETIGEEEIAELSDKEQLIMVYCRSGRRSKQAASKLVKLGYSNIVEIGGIIDWKGDIEK